MATRTYAVGVKILGMIEMVPADDSGAGDGEVREISVDAEGYAAGVAELRVLVPEGWRLLNVRRDAY